MSGRIFYGAAIQGERELGGRAHVHERLIERIRSHGCSVVLDHTSGRSRETISGKMERALGTLPPPGTMERRRIVRDLLVEQLEGEIDGAVFEVSTPSLGTGVEITHAYLRPRLGRPAIPILLLYEEGFWPHDLSTMIYGLVRPEEPKVELVRYVDLNQALGAVDDFVARWVSKNSPGV